MRPLPPKVRLTSNLTPAAGPQVGRGDIKYDIVKIGDKYIPQKTIGPAPVGQITEIKKLWFTSLDTNEEIDMTDNVKEIRIKYGD